MDYGQRIVTQTGSNTASLLVIVLVFAAWSLATKNWWICSWQEGYYEPIDSFDIRIARANDKRLISELRSFASAHELQLFVDKYTPGTVGVTHEVYAMQIFGCEMSIYFVNNWDPERYEVNFTKGPKIARSSADKFSHDLRSHLGRNFQIGERPARSR